MDESAPEWVCDALSYFEVLENGGKTWEELVNTWQAFEIHMGYPDSRNRLPTALRPEEVSMWMKDGRDYEKLPVNTLDLDVFSARWRNWWASLQPPCRRDPVSPWPLARVLPDDTSAWESLWRGGGCGFFLIVMCLAWWLHAISEREGSMPLKDVHDAIDDVLWVLRSIMEVHNGKRPSGMDRTDLSKHLRND
ncbi:hypothetical protein L226DRAFT_474072 [Lentinus tigrinus ALCF2SS1-7]|uniref:Uncharacterized protein n=1 Tax=Lentinus tigrinus ALCF2SS1-6 TaxID=1328759 RepID=A0A5C2RQJ1_9APHY|nr:hypothetical protein L227DRAFT_568437 [Lentinus tigrinus ALCF2SS1-6]RPD68022.1 hypothetical protein L226DRAFT_474072 [Lentinus tigrinus ALCF2SS1-7]